MGRPVHRIRQLIWISCRLFLPLFGAGLLGYMVFRAGPGAVWKQIQEVGWGLAVIILLGGLAQLVKTCAWRQTFTCDIVRSPGAAVLARSWPRMRSGNLVLPENYSGRACAYLCSVLLCHSPMEYRLPRLMEDCIRSQRQSSQYWESLQPYCSLRSRAAKKLTRCCSPPCSSQSWDWAQWPSRVGGS